VAALTAAQLEPDLAEVDVEFVVNDDDVPGFDRVELRQRADVPAGLVHVGARFGEHDRAPAEAAGGDLGAGALVHLERRIHPRREQVGDHEPDVVPGLGILRTRVAQADDQQGAPPACGGRLGH